MNDEKKIRQICRFLTQNLPRDQSSMTDLFGWVHRGRWLHGRRGRGRSVAILHGVRLGYGRCRIAHDVTVHERCDDDVMTRKCHNFILIGWEVDSTVMFTRWHCWRGRGQFHHAIFLQPVNTFHIITNRILLFIRVGTFSVLFSYIAMHQEWLHITMSNTSSEMLSKTLLYF